MLVVEALVKRYGKKGKQVTAVDGISFAVAPGETVGLLGGNGAGKTTTIGMILGLVAPSSGRVVCLGADMAKDPYAALPRMNFSSPYVEMPHRLTVRQNLSVYAGLYGLHKPAERIAEVAESLHLTKLLDRPAGALSAGQKTRVSVAKALINRPELLLLDEPTASLDPDTADVIRSLFESYRAATGAAILLTSHNMGEVERLCDRVLMMRSGRIIDQGAPAELIARHGRADLEAVFLKLAREADDDEDEPAASA